MNQGDLRTAIRDPTSVFENPEEVVTAKALTRADKIAILKSWAYDARELEVAEEEGMPGGGQSVLSQVLDALKHVAGALDLERPAPTKHHPLDD